MIILFGGSFDPVHNGHMAAVNAALTLFTPRELRFVPCGTHAFSKAIQASDADRLAMLQIALRDQAPNLKIDDREIARSGPSYTIDTVRAVRAELTSPDESVALLMGHDLLASLEQWKEWQHLLEEVHLIVVSRQADLDLPASLKTYIDAHTTRDPDELKGAKSGKIYFLEMPQVDLSSTQIRSALLRGECASEDLPEGVFEYIQRKKLYTTPAKAGGQR